jgi:oligopeptidase A
VETGATVPEDLYRKLRRARTYRAASAMMRQLGYAAVDLALHRDYDAARDGDPLAYTRRILERFSAAPLTEDHAMIAGFNHVFGSAVGYAAGYYSYKWAEVLDADAFTRFREQGIFSREAGAAFRSAILERGDSRDPMELYREFMGRDPALEPLLARAGLLAADAPGGAHGSHESAGITPSS